MIMIDERNSSIAEFHPEKLSRRGELVAWISTLITVVGWVILSTLNYPVFIGLKVLCILLGFAALSISLGNWMDRRTILKLTQDGVHFENGLRKATLNWNEIESVEVVPSTWGKKVSVFGQKSHFDFRTLGEVKVQEEVKGLLGFEKGDEILKHILNMAQLKQKSSPKEGYYYYSKS